jgi:hypothetical protein
MGQSSVAISHRGHTQHEALHGAIEGAASVEELGFFGDMARDVFRTARDIAETVITDRRARQQRAQRGATQPYYAQPYAHRGSVSQSIPHGWPGSASSIAGAPPRLLRDTTDEAMGVLGSLGIEPNPSLVRLTSALLRDAHHVHS